MSEFAVAGPADACAQELRRLATLGVSAIALAVPDVDFDDRSAMLERLVAAGLPFLEGPLSFST